MQAGLKILLIFLSLPILALADGGPYSMMGCETPVLDYEEPETMTPCIVTDVKLDGYQSATLVLTADRKAIAVMTDASDTLAVVNADGQNVLRFMTMDPHANESPSASPYAYCMGDPINLIDPNGMDVAILLVGDSFPGHMAILIQDTDGNWLYYSINGVESSWGASDRNDVGIQGNWNSPQEFLNMPNRKSADKDPKSDQNLNIYNYTDAFIISTTKEQDKKISSTFKDQSEKEYKVFGHNCATVVQNSLKSAGIRVADPEEYTVIVQSNFRLGEGQTSYQRQNIHIEPLKAFKSIKGTNNGTHIKVGRGNR